MQIHPYYAGTTTQSEVLSWIYHGRHECSFEIVSGDEFGLELVRFVGGSQGWNRRFDLRSSSCWCVPDRSEMSFGSWSAQSERVFCASRVCSKTKPDQFIRVFLLVIRHLQLSRTYEKYKVLIIRCSWSLVLTCFRICMKSNSLLSTAFYILFSNMI